MEQNLLLEQYSRFKKYQLEESPYRFLLNTSIEMNPHQINAFCAAVQALKTGGIIWLTRLVSVKLSKQD